LDHGGGDNTAAAGADELSGAKTHLPQGAMIAQMESDGSLSMLPSSKVLVAGGSLMISTSQQQQLYQ
jgi:hypothetical protein